MKNTEVLISGAGIAGPALAHWLRAAGYGVTIVERAAGPRPGGQTVDLRGAGRTVISRMGLMDQVRARSVEQAGAELVDARGRSLARMPEDAFGGEGIVSEIEILRDDLAGLLHDAVAGDVECLFDDTITGLRQDADGVDVTFESAPPRRFGLVVGADGIHSAVRAAAFGPEEDFLHPIGAYTAWFTMPADLGLDGWFRMYNAPGGLVASARPGRLPGETKAGLSFRSAPLTYDRRDPAAARGILAERFAGERGWEVPRLVEAMHDADDLAFEAIAQVRMEGWTRGRVALLGDAGYCASPLTGLGTSLALVGAYVLAGELAAAGGDHRAAFAGYQRVMAPYVAKAHELPPGGVRGYAPRRALGIRLRAASMRWMTRPPMRGILAAQFAKAGDIDLPNYPNTPTPDPATPVTPRRHARL